MIANSSACERAFPERARLIAQVYRVTGTWQAAEDSVDEAFARLAASDGKEELRDPVGWLAVVSTRLAIDQLRRRHRETYIGPWLPEPVDIDDQPDDVVTRADELRIAVLLAYEVLTPSERGALVLREGFEMPYSQIATALDATATTARKWVSRARRKLAAHTLDSRVASDHEVAELVDAILSGDVFRVIEMLADDVRLISDGGGKVNAALREIVGNRKCARFLVNGNASQDVEYATTRANGETALVVRSLQVTRVVQFGAVEGKICSVYFHCNPEKLKRVPLPIGWS